MSFFVCTNCGFGSASWYGKCPNCNQWNTLKENQSFSEDKKGKRESVKKITITPLKKISAKSQSRKKTGIYEFDRVLGGGFVPGEVILLTGEPGVGKSTLLLQSLQHLKTLYISGEESAEQIKNRADRLLISLDNLFFSNDLQIEGIIEGAMEMKNSLDIVVIDSIQTVYSRNIDGSSGSINQLKEVTKQLITLAKQNNIIIIIIGHITKEGDIAGPKTLEHFVDCVLNFEGEKISHYRLLRATKNRFGPTDEIGIFEMKADGLHQIDNPLVFLEKNKNSKKFESGKSIVGVIEGKRPLFFEIQTLITKTTLPVARRVVKGIDYNKALLLLAVIRKYLNIPLDNFDIYVNVVGGVSVKSTAADLGFIASLLSSLRNIPVSEKTVFIGEVGLLGEVREVYLEDKIISEANRLGFTKIFSSKNITNVRELNQIIKNSSN